MKSTHVYLKTIIYAYNLKHSTAGVKTVGKLSKFAKVCTIELILYFMWGKLQNTDTADNELLQLCTYLNSCKAIDKYLQCKLC